MGVARVSIAISILIAASFAPLALAGDELFINNSDVKWGPAPPSLPKGARLAVL